MSEKKGLWTSLFGGSRCDCGMTVDENKTDEQKKRPKKGGGCCNMKIVEEDVAKENGDTGA